MQNDQPKLTLWPTLASVAHATSFKTFVDLMDRVSSDGAQPSNKPTKDKTHVQQSG